MLCCRNAAGAAVPWGVIKDAAVSNVYRYVKIKKWRKERNKVNKKGAV
jgi:hypothetical protein